MIVYYLVKLSPCLNALYAAAMLVTNPVIFIKALSTSREMRTVSCGFLLSVVCWGFFCLFSPFPSHSHPPSPFLLLYIYFFSFFFLPYLLLITISPATHKRQFCASLVSERGTSRWCVGREQGATEEKRMENPNVFCPGDGNSALKSPWGGEDGTSAPLMLSIRKLSAARCRNAG